MKKVSGIVRKLDELGRIVIPKEIRRTLNLREGSDIEISVREDELILRKFSTLLNICSLGEVVLDSLYETLQRPCILTDSEQVIITKGVSKKDLIGQKLSKEFCRIASAGEYRGVEIVCNKKLDGFIAPVFSQGFWCGSIMVFGETIDKTEIISFAANFLSGLLV